MRGQAKEIKSLTISGKIYLDIEEETEIRKAEKGDLYLYLFLESSHTDPFVAYYKKGYKGYFKVKIYDGYNWCQLDYFDFFEEKENHFTKSDISINCFYVCKEMLLEFIDQPVYKTYRCHYSRYKYESTENYKGKKGHFKKKS